MNRLLERVLEHPVLYRLSQAPFGDQKLPRIFAQTDPRTVRRVLDVGCGPGTNTAYFAHADYLGVDINPRYIAEARRRYRRDFIAADATAFTVPQGARFDFILVNSLLHHLDLLQTRRVLSRLAPLLSEEGCIHCIEVVMPERWGPPRLMARADRGRFCRPIEEWRSIFSEFFRTVVFEHFVEKLFGIDCLEFVYFKGAGREGSCDCR